MTTPAGMKPGTWRPAQRVIRDVVTCPDCGEDADACIPGGDHSGACVQRFGFAAVPAAVDPVGHEQAIAAALAIIRDVAEHQGQVSANSTRAMMDAAGIAGTVRSAAFRAAVRADLIEYSGYASSTDTGPHAHKSRVRTYRSLIYRPAAHTRRAVAR